MRWFEVKIKTTNEVVEAVTSILYELGASGVVVEDPNDALYQEGATGDWDYLDVDEIKFEYAGTLIKTYYDEEGVDQFMVDLKEKMEALKEFGLNPGEIGIEKEEVFETDWANEWKKYFKPFKLGSSMVIKPTWEDYDNVDGDTVIEIDPGGSFGSGTHETTSMCVEHIENYVKEGDRVFDIGCGSGILGIAAALRGAKEVLAVDMDPVSVIDTANNAKINNVDHIVKAVEGNLVEVVEGTADVIVANIIADIICILAKDVKTFMTKDTVFISSGILNDKVDMVKDAFDEQNLEIVKVVSKGEWSSVVAKVK